MLLSFFLVSPFVFLSWAEAYPFLKHLQNISHSLNSGFSHHVKMLFYGAGPVVFILSILGWAFVPKKHWRQTAALAVFGLLYFWAVVQGGQKHERYILPLIPLGCMVAGCAMQGILHAVHDSKMIQKIILGFVLMLWAIFDVSKTVYSDMLFLREDTRDAAKAYALAQAAPGSTLLIDEQMLSPKFRFSQSQIAQKIDDLRFGGGGNDVNIRRLESLRDAKNNDEPEYELYFLSHAPDDSPFIMAEPKIPYDDRAVRDLDADFIFTNPTSMTKNAEFYAKLSGFYARAADFSPKRNPKESIAQDWTYLPIDQDLWNYKYPGAHVVILKKVREASP
jgi:hypothetical protein